MVQSEIIIPNEYLGEIIKKSQHCYRNWDLSKEIPDGDIDTMITSVTQCPSKQNRVFYKIICIKNREKIEAIHKATNGYVYDFRNQLSTTNSQVLANVLFVFVSDKDNLIRTNEEYHNGIELGRTKKDEYISLGVGAAYLILTANLLGYDTGVCQCLDNNIVKDILNTDKNVLLLVGIGIGDKNRSRLEHHNDPNFKFSSFEKNIKVEIIN